MSSTRIATDKRYKRNADLSVLKQRINAAAVALQAQMSVKAFSETDLAYAPPFGPVWDPLLTAANQLLKKM